MTDFEVWLAYQRQQMQIALWLGIPVFLIWITLMFRKNNKQ